MPSVPTHDYIGPDGGSCMARPNGSPCGYSAEHDVHVDAVHPHPFAPAFETSAARRRKARSQPWTELPLVTRAMVLVVAAGPTLVFLAACVALTHWLLHIGGLL